MKKIVIYSSKTCTYCLAAEKLLQSKGINDIEKIMIDVDTHRDEMVKRTGRRTVPQIFIDDKHIGGYDDLQALNTSGQLDSLLSA